MSGLKRQLTIKDGLALGIGSIMGSGILFLPSLSAQIAGHDVLIAWGLTTLFCLPLLLVFSEMVRAVPNEHGIAGFIRLGLGRHMAASVPILMLGTVGLGMPSAAIIAGRYVSRMLDGGYVTETGTALALVLAAIIANIRGVKCSSQIQGGVAFALFLLALLLLLITMPAALPRFGALKPTWDHNKILSASMVAFWAYAGFENMTFAAGEFKRPQRDIVISIVLSLLICSGLYFGLTAHYTALIPANAIDPMVGLRQLAHYAPYPQLVSGVVTLLAFGAVLINLTSWSWGVSRLIYASAGDGSLPSWLHKLSAKEVPSRALFAMVLLFLAVIVCGIANPEIFETCLKVVSTNFVVLYLLCVWSYTRYVSKLWKKLMGYLLLVALCFCLIPSAWFSIYPVTLILVSAVLSRLRCDRNERAMT